MDDDDSGLPVKRARLSLQREVGDDEGVWWVLRVGFQEAGVFVHVQTDMVLN